MPDGVPTPEASVTDGVPALEASEIKQCIICIKQYIICIIAFISIIAITLGYHF